MRIGAGKTRRRLVRSAKKGDISARTNWGAVVPVRVAFVDQPADLRRSATTSSRAGRVELSDLAIFAAVAKCGGITRAATQVNTVQSNVTTRVQALEGEIGVALFERHSRGVTLTAAGKRLLPYAERFASMSREAIFQKSSS
jgi:hypothetical protein